MTTVNQDMKIIVFKFEPQDLYLAVLFYPKNGQNFLQNDLVTTSLNVVKETF